MTLDPARSHADNDSMRDPGRTTTATRTAALLAVAVAICAGGPALGAVPSPVPPPVPASADQRRVEAEEHEQAVASLIACLNEAARSLAGAPVAVLPAHPSHPAPLTATPALPLPADDLAVPPLQLHLSRLVLPPPTEAA